MSLEERAAQVEVEASRRRRSAWITMGVAGALVVGVPVLFYQCDGEENPVAEGQAYPNNYYVPGAGYYHAGFGQFYPIRYQEYDAARGGYYYGGSWHREADAVSQVAASVPTRTAASQANAGFRAAQPSSRGGFGRTGSFFSARS